MMIPCDRCKRSDLPLIQIDMNARDMQYMICVRCVVEEGLEAEDEA